MTTFKYKIIEFAPSKKMDKLFNDLGKDGWELVSVTPLILDVSGDVDTSWGTGGGETKGHFEKMAAYFKKVI